MKRNLFLAGILGITLVFGLILSGCPTEATDDTPSGKLGDKTLKLTGTVYTRTTSGTSYTYDKYETGNTVVLNIGNVTNKEFALTGGKLEIALADKPTTGFTTLTDANAKSLFGFSSYDTVTIEPKDAKGWKLNYYLKSPAGLLSKASYKISGSATSGKSTSETVAYYYVDKAVTITLTEEKATTTLLGVSMTSTHKGATLKLGAGWNAIYTKNSGSTSSSSYKSTSTVSVANPKLRWIKN
jgi:hypothetical protein